MHVVCRSIQRVDNPSEFIRSRRSRRFALFFADKPVLRKTVFEKRFNRRLRREIGVGHKVAKALLPRLKSAAPFQELLATRAGSGLTCFKPVGHAFCVHWIKPVCGLLGSQSWIGLANYRSFKAFSDTA